MAGTPNNSTNYQTTQYNTIAGGANNNIANIAPGTAGFILTSNGASAFPTFQPPATRGQIIYFLQSTASGVATYDQLLLTEQVASTAIPFAGVTAGSAVLQNWITQPGEPGITSIPAGFYEFEVYADQSAGTRTVTLYAEVWEADAAGVDIAKIDTTDSTTDITATPTSYLIRFAAPIYPLTSSASRITLRLFATASALGTDATVNISVGGMTDSNLLIPGPSVAGLVTVAIQTFTTNGTYTPTPGMQYCVIETVGGGGGGGGSQATGGAAVASAGGGGAGEYARGVFSAATIGASQSVTVGSGGTGVAGSAGNAGTATSVGSLISANGATGGPAGAPGGGSSSNGGLGGTGGTGGNFRTPGGAGYNGVAAISPGILVFVSGGCGGTSIYGAGGIGTNVAPGNAGLGYGSGGSGGSNTISMGANAGGTGANGIVIITEYV